MEPPLSNLVARCQTICVAECCGVDAFDFSPIQIASYLTMWRGSLDLAEVAKLYEQIEGLTHSFDMRSANGSSVTIDEINQTFTEEDINSLAAKLRANIEVAIELIQISDLKKYKPAERGGGCKIVTPSAPTS